MQMRALFYASLAATLTSAAIAQPPAQPASPAAAQPAPSRPPQVLLASAEQAQSAAKTPEQQATAKPHRAARVTSCRCGDQIADPSEDPSEGADQE